MHAHQILFVEDDILMSVSTCEFIRDRGMRVIQAEDAASAMTVIDKRGYISGLVSDIDLGLGEDGFEVARRARAAYPDLPVVFVSGTAAARHAIEGVEGSVFINKPYHPRQITDAIAALSAARAPKGPPPPSGLERQTPSALARVDRTVDMEGRSFASTDDDAPDELASTGRTWRHVAPRTEWQDAVTREHAQPSAF